ncbi:MAG TPA: Rrf2 family transcriptional regulator [Gemmataceae bacterium]|jgi:Rrf2 family protein|nr:Rrf2 family transcriptional regulator [Gemmataceae bacterium]
MALLTRKVDYAILVLSHLHQNLEGGCAREIAARFGLSRAFVANILKELCHKGYVASHRGVKGGYVLLRSADRVNLADFIEAMDDPFHLTVCTEATAGDGCTISAHCPVRAPLAAIHHKIREVLRAVTLADLFHGTGPAATVEELLTLGV